MLAKRQRRRRNRTYKIKRKKNEIETMGDGKICGKEQICASRRAHRSVKFHAIVGSDYLYNNIALMLFLELKKKIKVIAATCLTIGVLQRQLRHRVLGANVAF